MNLRTGLAILTLIVIAVAGYRYYTGLIPAQAADSNPTATPEKPTAEAAKALDIQPTDIVHGDAKAKVTIIEYASLTCSHCAAFNTHVLPELEKNYIDTGKVKLVQRPFPLNEPALRAAQLTYCVPKEQYTTFTKVLFTSQGQWAYEPDYRASLSKIAGVGGMSKEAFDACMENKDVETRVLASRKTGEDLKVDSTPTFFINGEKFAGGRTIAEFSKAIDPLLK